MSRLRITRWARWWLPAVFALLMPAAAEQPLPGKPHAPADSAEAEGPKGLDLQATEPSAAVKNRWALLIGVNNYENIHKLRFCADDMAALGDALIKHGGYAPERVRLLCDAEAAGRKPTRGSILLELNTLLTQVEPDDAVLFAFSGHGACDATGRTYLIPIDGSDVSDDALSDTGVPMKRVYEYLQRCKAQQKIVILDACHAGGVKGDSTAPAYNFKREKFVFGQGMVELDSCNDTQVSHERTELKHGLFTHFLVEALNGKADKDGDGVITADEAYEFTLQGVTKYVTDHKLAPLQTPKFRVPEGGVIGRITLATTAARSRPADAPTVAELDSAELLQRLHAMQRQGTASEQLVKSATRWFGPENDPSLTRDVRLLMALWARGNLSEPQFLDIARPLLPRLESRLAAAGLYQRCRVHAVHIGIDKYAFADRSAESHEIDLAYAVSDARLLADTVRNGTSRAAQTIVTNDQATGAQVRKVIREAASACQPADVLLITYAGQGVKGNPPSMKEHREQKSRDSPALPHRGLEDVYNTDAGGSWVLHGPHSEQRLDLLPMDELAQIVESCRGHVLIVSDACNAFPESWDLLYENLAAPLLVPGASADDARESTDVSLPKGRVFIGLEAEAMEWSALKGGLLTFLVAQGLLGHADTLTPRAVLGPGRTSVQSTMIAAPDGFVSLAELVAFVKAMKESTIPIVGTSDLSRKSLDKLVVRGRLGSETAILTRSTLPD
ncbi:MAG TPA: caspase family protein [Pirellulales bacterium]